jgi:site-specific DNA-methyltransferase (adenine-specific)
MELNTIHNVDCMVGLNNLEDSTIDLIILDPPYLVTKESWDKKEVVTEELSEQLFRVAKYSCSLYVWCGIGEKSQSLIRWFPIFNNQWTFKDLVTWKKQRGIGMRKGWLYTREEVMWFVKNNKKFIWNVDGQYSEELRLHKHGFNGGKTKSEFKRWTNVWTDVVEESFDTKFKSSTNVGHFTPKPLKAIERIIKLHTKEHDIVLDCFMGSGTTAIAAINLNRNFIGFELDSDICSAANNRIKEIV